MNIENKTISDRARRRAADLLSRMTTEEKVRQLGCTLLSGCDEVLDEKDLRGASARLR